MKFALGINTSVLPRTCITQTYSDCSRYAEYYHFHGFYKYIFSLVLLDKFNSS